MTAFETLLWVSRILGVAIALHTLELWHLRGVMADDGVWRWSDVRADVRVFPGPVVRLLDALLRPRAFSFVLATRIACAVWIVIAPHALPAVLLWLGSLLIALRFRGSFNGGSDFMTLVVLSGLCVATLLPSPLASVGALWWIALQACNSYLLAGWVKLRTASWRSGEAFSVFMRSTIFGSPGLPRLLIDRPFASRAIAWSVIAFECAFPMALAGPRACLAFTVLAGMFHVTNAYVIGIHRFVLAWAATYPAIYWCSQHWLPA